MKSWWKLYLISLAVFCCGLILSGGIFYISGVRNIPSRLADIYREDQIGLSVPGSRSIQLSREGAYGIYFQYRFLASESWSSYYPPDLDCILVSDSGQVIRGVPDYEPRNRYWSTKDAGPATLIQSITVEQPGRYDFSCDQNGEYSGPEIRVTLGPNYVWEFIRISSKYFLAILGILISILIPISISLILLALGLLDQWSGNRISGEGPQEILD